MAQITLKNVSKFFNGEAVVKNLQLTIKEGSFTVLVGPSGCGKSTTLRMIAGLEKQTTGDIWIGDRCVNDIPPGKRDIAMVFQNYALYPTMTVRENIEFGLINKKIPKDERRQRINDITEIVGLTPFLDKKPQVLSGGQRQRVALARAMVKKPQVFIFDEPLSNLDAKLRHQMRSELIELHKRLGTTFVYVTHDQVEAMSMGDQIVILNQGEIQQVAPPLDIYRDPENTFTAAFIGTPAMNIFKYDKVNMYLPHAKIAEVGYIGFRPEMVSLSTQAPHGQAFILPGEMMTRETLGSEVIYKVKTSAGHCLVKQYLSSVERAEKVYLSVDYRDLYFFNHHQQRIRPMMQEQASPVLLEVQ
ncbi:ABC transporter ATP-binding protein [Caldalkalibacillus salinus]|uniref:ABC transporter ATP-binding protein n=1 Tax=Caldalkalibacillus salinus TaxID=2803787 RepID=UPI0019247C16|nr:ABC transporter ATP-binding protein [Caldalkalibacillus salinus]